MGAARAPLWRAARTLMRGWPHLEFKLASAFACSGSDQRRMSIGVSDFGAGGIFIGRVSDLMCRGTSCGLKRLDDAEPGSAWSFV